MGFIEAFTQLGVGVDSLLADTGIDVAMLEDSNAKISYRQQQALVQNGIQRYGKSGVGLLVGQLFDWNYYGTVGYVVQCSPSLYAATEALARYLMIAQPYYAMHPRRPDTYIDENDQVLIELQPYPYFDQTDPVMLQFQMEFRLALTLRVWDLCGNKSVPDPSVRVCLNYPKPPHAALYDSLPCASIQFGGDRSYVAAHHQFVTKPFRPMRRHAFKNLMKICEEELRNAKLETTYTAKVRWHVHSRFNNQVTIEEVAALLQIGQRSLERKLADENTTFRDIVQDVRMELAAYHLRCSKLGVDQIAALMGFSSASSLRRAIRNWSGEPRRALQAYMPASERLATD